MTRVDQERQYWEAAADSDNLRDEWLCDKKVTDEQCLEAIIPAIEKYQQLQRASILEVGCGVGRLTSLVKKKYPDAFVAGIDISPKMLKLAEEYSGYKRDTEHPSKYPFYYLTDGRTIPGENIHFPAIYSMATFQHIDQEGVQAYINEAYRVMSPGGIFRFQYVEGDEQEPFSQHYREANMTGWLRDAGFTVKEIDRGLIFPQWTWVTAVMDKK